jgi:predicted ATP-dependent endonuclease of OLD family
VWFFSFLIWFSQVKRNYGENLIILLDEPGLSLHARAQEDLLQYIHDELVPNHQVFYTTHSPFMVDQDLNNVRTVEDVIAKDGKLLGTKIGDEVFSNDADTLFPLQAALGYNITQTLFIGKNTLLVEGPSDLLYIKWFSNQLQKHGREFLNKQWVVTPMGGIDKVSSFVALFKGNKLNTVVLTDFHTGDKKKIENLKALKILKESALFTADTYTGKKEADIEDLIGENTYIELVNLAYGLKATNRLKRHKNNTSTSRVLEVVEDHFRTLPSDVREFDHYYPAEFFVSNTDEILKNLPGLEEAYNRFEKLFKDINIHIKN